MSNLKHMACPDCGQYSLTYDYERNGWICHVYNGFIPDEHMPCLSNYVGLPPEALAENTFKVLFESATLSVKEAREFLGVLREKL